MAQLSYIETNTKKEPISSLNIPTDESIGAFLFDISGFTAPFDSYPILYHNFKDGTIQCVKNMDEALLLGIQNDGFLGGLLYYHLSRYFDFMEGEQTVYVAIADCSESWDVIQYMQRQTSGKLFHIGVWTSQQIWRLCEDGSIGFSPLITNLQAQANEINGEVGKSTHTMTPLNIVLCGNSYYVDGHDIDYRQLPDAVQLNCPNISVLLAQNGSSQIKDMQKLMPSQAPVSALGIVMACLSLCGAEESIASVDKCDLNKREGFNNPEWGLGFSGTSIDSVHQIWSNIISSRGYIIPVSYEAIEASYFLSSDQTLSQGDFGSIANNRVMHKCRRAMCTALVPYINGNMMVATGNGSVSNTTMAIITQSVNTALDSTMLNKDGLSQINGRVLTFLDNNGILETDSVSMKLEVIPANYSSYISEEVSHDII